MSEYGGLCIFMIAFFALIYVGVALADFCRWNCRKADEYAAKAAPSSAVEHSAWYLNIGEDF